MPLQIPDRRQRLDYDCGVAALDSVCAFFSLREGAARSLACPITGIDPATVETVLRSLGLSVLSGSMTVDVLKTLTRGGWPVLCPVSLFSGHWVVVAGVERGRVHFQCPVNGPTAVGAKRWREVWRDRSRTTEYHNWGIACMTPTPFTNRMTV